MRPRKGMGKIHSVYARGNGSINGLPQVRESMVEGAGLGLFASKDLENGAILGSYPGRKWPQQLWLNRKAGGSKDSQAKARTYVWAPEISKRMSSTELIVPVQDDGTVIDPTNSQGELEDFVPWLLPGSIRLPTATVPTILSRINEPVSSNPPLHQMI